MLTYKNNVLHTNHACGQKVLRAIESDRGKEVRVSV